MDGLGRYCNDDDRTPNAVIKKLACDNVIHLCIYALKDIKIEDEIRYDYGPDEYNTMTWRKVRLFLLFYKRLYYVINEKLYRIT